MPLVEEGWHDDPVTELVARRYLEPVLAEAVDPLVLGCTHYPLLADVLARTAGPAVRLVDSAESTARTVAGDLDRLDLLATQRRPEHHFCVTDAAERFHRIARTFLGGELARLELVEV